MLLIGSRHPKLITFNVLAKGRLRKGLQIVFRRCVVVLRLVLENHCGGIKKRKITEVRTSPNLSKTATPPK